MPITEGSTEKVDLKSAALELKSARSSRPKWRYIVLVAFNFTLAGVIGGVLLVDRAEVEQRDDSKPAPPIDVLQTIAKGDELLMAGKPNQAMDLYRLAARVGSASPKSLSYRLGVGAEQINDMESALEHYKSAASYEPSETSFAASLGQARIHYRQGNTELSANILAKIATVSALPVYASTRVGRDIDFLMGLVRAKQVLGQLPTSQLDAGHVCGFDVVFTVDHLLGLVPLEGYQLDVPRAIAEDSPIGIQLHGPAGNPSTTLLSARFSNVTVSVLLDALAAATTWKISLTDIANEVASAKRVDVQLRDQTAGELLSLILEPQRLFWTYDGDTLAIDRIENVSRKVVQTRSQTRSQRLLEAALAIAPDHLLASQAYLALGNLSALQGRHDRAIAFYREVAERFHGQGVAQAARFNLAKMLYQKNDVASATDAFYEVVDQRQGTELEPLAYLYLGRIYFDRGDLKKAKVELARSLALTNERTLSATGSLTLASVYVMQPDAANAASANAVLMEKRAVLQHEPFRDKAIFLSALTRYRAAVTPDDMRRRAQELVAASVRVDPSGFFGDFGYLLVGNAFADLNLRPEAVRLYQLGLSRPGQGSLRDELTYRLAVEYRKQHEFELAKNALLELSAGSPTWAPKATVELADLLLQTRRYEECVQHCKWSLEQQYSEQDNMALLRLLGQVYEELGDHEKAGICFAGFVPGNITRIAEVTK